MSEVCDPDPVTYFSVQAPKMPNMFILFGPNSAPFAGSITHMFEGAAGYIIKCVLKIQREYIKSITVKEEATMKWVGHVDHHMSRKTLSAPVSNSLLLFPFSVPLFEMDLVSGVMYAVIPNGGVAESDNFHRRRGV